MRAMSFEWYGRIFVIAIALMLSSSLAAYAKKKVQNKTFVVVGTSLIQGGNVQAAAIQPRHCIFETHAVLAQQIRGGNVAF